MQFGDEYPSEDGVAVSRYDLIGAVKLLFREALRADVLQPIASQPRPSNIPQPATADARCYCCCAAAAVVVDSTVAVVTFECTLLVFDDL